MSPPDRGRVRVGIGGWTYAPWRGVFYPEGLPQSRELEYAAARLTSIEINGTFYGSQKPESFARWRDETPDGFVFSVKGPRFVVQKRRLAETGESVDRFFASGLDELGDKLGPVLWTLPPTKRFEPEDLAAFLDLLPRRVGGRPARHAIEARHDSFLDPAFPALLRAHGVAAVFSEHETYPALADVTTDFVYARLQKGDEALDEGYPPGGLDAWADRLALWAEGGAPADLPRVGLDAEPRPREVFAYVIHEAKLRAPAAAMGLIARLKAKGLEGGA